MILQADVTLHRMIFVGDVELVHGSVRTEIWLRPFGRVHPGYLFAIQFDLDDVLVARDDDVVPFAGRFRYLLRGLHEIVQRAGIVVARSLRVIDRDLDAIEAHILALSRHQRVRPNEDAAVATLADFEVERQDVVFPGILVDHHVTAAFMRIDGTIFDRSLARLPAAGHPALQRFAVEEKDPAIGLFFRSQFVVGGADT